MQQPRRNVREVSRQQTELIRHAIAEKIENKEWNAGDRLPTEEALVRQFQAARNTVRKAMSALEADGIIERHVGRGTFVAGPKQEASDESDDGYALCGPADVMEARLTLEPAIARLAVVRASPADIRKAKWCLEQLANADDFEEHEKLDAELHWTIINASRNELYKKIYIDINTIRSRSEWRTMKLASLSQEIKDAYHIEHSEIVEAFAARDADRLAEALTAHLKHVGANLLAPARM